MRLLLFLLIAGLSERVPPSVDRFPQSDSPFSGCNNREVAAGIQAGARVPRNILYHYGKREMMMKDVIPGNIPQEDWDRFIMGKETRFHLKQFRRGFFATEQLEDADRFGGPEYNWLVEIHLKPECLKPERVSSLVYLPQKPEFKSWYESKKYATSFDQFRQTCFDERFYPRESCFQTHESESLEDRDTEKVVTQYEQDHQIAFAHDYAGDLIRSWAIKDRSCIAKIEGSDAFWAKAFASRAELWKNQCNRVRNHRNAIRVWFAALANSEITQAILKDFSKTVNSVRAPDDEMIFETREMNRFAAQDFSEELVHAHSRCGKKNEDSFKQELIKIAEEVDQLQSSDVKTRLEQLCR